MPGDIALVDMAQSQIDPVRLRGRRGIRHCESRDVGQGDGLRLVTRGRTGLLECQSREHRLTETV